MRGDRAAELGIASLEDLAPLSPQLAVGGDVEFFERPEWIAVRDTYGLRFAGQRNYTATFMYDALTGGEADVISAFSSDGRIAADRLTVLDDPKGALPGYDALLLVSPRHAGDVRFIEALWPLVGAISVEVMREANYSVDRSENKLSPREAAEKLAERISR
jgi:osmoprotectant transport system permease protein